MTRYTAYITIGIIFILTSITEGQNPSAPAAYQITEAELVISGTSNVRDWEATSDDIRETITFGSGITEWANSASMSERLQSNDFSGSDWVDEISFSIPAKSLDSGISAMNETMYNHLLAERHPVINYYVSEVKEIQASENPDELHLIVTGNIRAAGEDYTLAHMVRLSREETGTITASGDLEMRMTDFLIKPPEFMRGALVTEDQFQIRYTFTFAPQE